jgi:hypothetical protein
MATLREYFDADFGYAIRINCKIPFDGATELEVVILYDFAGYKSFIACYVHDASAKLEQFLLIVEALKYGQTQLQFAGNIKLPASQFFPGKLEVRNEKSLEIRAQFFDDPAWISIHEIEASRRLFIYSEAELTIDEIISLKEAGKKLGHDVQFRSKRHADERATLEKPLAFISHDSRDKQEVARKIALNLQRLMCPVWYDEFSLQVGSNLRDSIEKGLKECKKCVLVLSPNFFENKGWTKKEFDSLFTREILEQTQLVLPVWYGVNSKAVYEYSPSLLNVLGLSWNELGEEETCRRLHRAIVGNQA